VAFEEALRPGFKQYAEQILVNARALCEALLARGFRVVSGGTDNHLFVLDFSGGEMTGLRAQKTLDRAGITTSKSTVPGEKRSAWVTSGLRIGTPAVTTREMGAAEMKQIGGWIADVLDKPEDEARIARIRDQVRELALRFPLPYAPPA
jgi:glycine hydroxymethyltransferase